MERYQTNNFTTAKQKLNKNKVYDGSSDSDERYQFGGTSLPIQRQNRFNVSFIRHITAKSQPYSFKGCQAMYFKMFKMSKVH